MVKYTGLVLLLVIILTALVLTLGGVLLTIAWNVFVPSMFGGPALEFIQGLAIVGTIWIFSNIWRGK